MTEAAPSDRLDRGTLTALVAMALGVFVVANDFSALSVALPQIESDFDSDVSTVQWVINAYALVFGVLIVSSGRLADLFGRRRIFFVGAGIFALFSLLAGAAQSDAWLIACRALMGIGGSMMWPAVLGMTFALLPDSKAGLAGGLILGVAGLGNALGPLIGGALTDALSWRWILFVNLPVAGFAVLITWWKVHLTEPATGKERFDYRGVATLSIALVALLVALDEVPDLGWGDPRIIGLLVVAAVLLPAFAFSERAAGARALVPRDVIGNRQFAFACIAVLFMSAAFFVSLLYLPQFMQKLLSYSALEAGIGLLPMMALFAISSFVAGPLYQRLGAKAIVSTGAGCVAVGMFLISLVEAESGYAALVPGMAVLGLGIGLFYSSITTAGVTAIDPSRASLAGAIVYMCQVAGGAIGLGLTTTIFTSISQGRVESDVAATGANLSPTEVDAVDGILAGTESAQQAVAGLGSGGAREVTTVVREAFVDGFVAGFRLNAVLAAVAFAVAVLLIGGSPRLRRHRRAEAPSAAGEQPAGQT